MNRQFPPEIIQLIVEASLDRYDLFHHYISNPKLRYATLRSYSLLNSTWCGASQAELVKWVAIRTNLPAIKFLELTQQRGGTLGGVKDMYVRSACFTDASTLVKLLRCAPQVVNLYVYGGSVDVYDLAQLQQLRRLRLISCSIVGSPSSSLLRLPQLRRLSLYDCATVNSAPHFLTPAFLPRLRHFDTDDLGIIAPLIQQLEIITYNSDYPDYAILARAKSLLLLPFPVYAAPRLNMFSKLPSLPSHQIRLATRAEKPGRSRRRIEGLLGTRKSGLRVILLNDYGTNDSIRSLIQRFQARGVRVQSVDEMLDFEGAIIEMEKIRAEEAREAGGSDRRHSTARVGL